MVRIEGLIHKIEVIEQNRAQARGPVILTADKFDTEEDLRAECRRHAGKRIIIIHYNVQSRHNGRVTFKEWDNMTPEQRADFTRVEL